MKKEVNFQTEYEVKNADINLTIVIGKGQPGSSRVRLGDDVVGDGEVKDLLIGNGDNIKNKILKITTVVDDFQINTNETCVEYLLTGGKESKKYYLEATVDVDGDRVNYFTEIKFI